MIDRDGRLFGRFNLVDALAIAVVLFLIPVGYATYLLFRPSRPVIESVTRVEVTAEERRVAGGVMLTAKLKVRGSGLNPLLRARIGEHDSLGFVFENPNSADVLVGIIPAGKHDLILYDGVQEVARARAAVDLVPPVPTTVRAYGWLTMLPPGDTTLKTGYASEPHVPGAFRVNAIGEARPARSRVTLGGSVADLPVHDRVERPAELLLNCDYPSMYACAVAGQTLTQPPPVTLVLAGSYTFQFEEIGPPAPPTPVTIRVQLEAQAAGMQRGDRDDIVGARAAEITAIAGSTITVRAGADSSREGWRYRGQLLTPGAPFTLKTARYAVTGNVVEISVDGASQP